MDMGRDPAFTESLFWMKVKSSLYGCWEWQAHINRYGYGCFAVDGRGVGAHRYSYVLHGGQLGPGVCALHTCDNRRCVRPDHLFAGTKTDNNLDRDRKGRQSVGVKQGDAKLDNDKVRVIIESYNNGGVTLASLASHYKVDSMTIWKVIHRRTWKHVAVA